VAETNLQSRTEAVQPSLWDRLVDDLPGIVVESDRRRAELSAQLGAARVDRVLAGGLRALQREDDLDEPEARALAQLVQQFERRAFLENRAVVVTADVLRDAVRRDIEALFNIERLASDILLSDREHDATESPAALLADFPEVRRSVVNFGAPSFAGRTESDFNTEALARDIREVLAVFEPRLKRDTIKVVVSFSPKTGMRIVVDGTLMVLPVAERLRLSTTVDLDSGRAATRVEAL
jgi:type VI secretion system protein ImpF